MIQNQGPGWRLARDTLRDSFPVLIGGESWAIEITEDEWNSLVPLLSALLDELIKIESQLMSEESIFIEMDKSPWWACLDGDRQHWSLKLVLEGEGDSRRGFEAFWPHPSAQAIVLAMRTIWDCSQKT